jgi:hypothetical protein
MPSIYNLVSPCPMMEDRLTMPVLLINKRKTVTTVVDATCLLLGSELELGKKSGTGGKAYVRM